MDTDETQIQNWRGRPAVRVLSVFHLFPSVADLHRHSRASRPRSSFAFTRPRITRLRQPHVQIVDPERQFAEQIDAPGVELPLLRPPLHRAETFAERDVFVRVAEFAQQAFY